MRVYFSAEERCLLRLGGAAAGFCGRAAKFADIGEEGAQAEFLPADGNLLPLSFYIYDGFFREPPACCTVCLYGCGADVLARFSPREKPLAAPVQARADGVLFTVFGGAMPSLVLENGHGMEIVPLPPAERYEAGRAEIGGESFPADFLLGQEVSAMQTDLFHPELIRVRTEEPGQDFLYDLCR